MKKTALLLLVLMILSVVFSACADEKPSGNDQNEPANNPTENNEENETPTNENQEEPTKPVQDDAKVYKYNPKLVAAYAVDAKTVRVQFSAPVYDNGNDLLTHVMACTDPETLDGAVKASAVDYLEPAILTGDRTYSKYFDFTFESDIPAGGYICFVENVADTDHDGELVCILADNAKTGLYGQYRIEGKDPVAAIQYTDEVIEKPETPTIMLRAYYKDVETQTIRAQFTKPVAYITGHWEYHTFACDVANPNPGTGGSWQVNLLSAEPVDPQDGEDGFIYASVWDFTFNSQADGSAIPENGVIRFSENAPYNDDNFPDEEQNADLGRIIKAIDGTLLKASNTEGWDVSHCAYSTDPATFFEVK